VNLSDLLHDTVDDLEPEDRLDAIRTRTTSAAHRARPWWWAAGGVVAATAATVVLVAALGAGPDPDPTAGSGHEGHDGPTEVTGDHWTLLPTYYLGDTPGGQRLFREFVPVQTDDPLQAALDRIQEAPEDPDYSTPWESGTFVDVSVVDSVIEVETASAQPLRMTALELEQVAYSLAATLGSDLPVRFVHDGEPTAAGELGPVAWKNFLSPVNISDPAELTAYSGSMIARGRAATTTGRVPWELADESGTVVRSGSAPLDGGPSRDHLRAWETTVDLSGLSVGTYLFTVRVDDSATGHPSADTRRISVS
jgi:hypothetical protein